MSCYDYLNVLNFSFRVQVKFPDLPETYEPEKKPGVPHTVKEDRKLLIDATIVRTMKSNKQLKVLVCLFASLEIIV